MLELELRLNLLGAEVGQLRPSAAQARPRSAPKLVDISRADLRAPSGADPSRPPKVFIAPPPVTRPYEDEDGEEEGPGWNVGASHCNPYKVDSWPFEPNVLAQRMSHQSNLEDCIEGFAMHVEPAQSRTHGGVSTWTEQMPEQDVVGRSYLSKHVWDL